MSDGSVEETEHHGPVVAGSGVVCGPSESFELGRAGYEGGEVPLKSGASLVAFETWVCGADYVEGRVEGGTACEESGHEGNEVVGLDTEGLEARPHSAGEGEVGGGGLELLLGGSVAEGLGEVGSVTGGVGSVLSEELADKAAVQGGSGSARVVEHGGALDHVAVHIARACDVSGLNERIDLFASLWREAVKGGFLKELRLREGLEFGEVESFVEAEGRGAVGDGAGEVV